MAATLTAKTALVRGAPVAKAPRAARRAARASGKVFAKYGEENQYFDLNDLENTIGAWDMYGQDAKQRYNGLQSEFFERAAGSLNRREYLLGLVALGGVGILAWGAKGSKDVKLPITVGPQKGGEPGPRGRI